MVLYKNKRKRFLFHWFFYPTFFHLITIILMKVVSYVKGELLKSNLPQSTPIFSNSLQPTCIRSVNPLTPMSDQDRISPYNINTISSRQVMRIKKNINEGMISWSTTKFSKQHSESDMADSKENKLWYRGVKGLKSIQPGLIHSNSIPCSPL